MWGGKITANVGAKRLKRRTIKISRFIGRLRNKDGSYCFWNVQLSCAPWQIKNCTVRKNRTVDNSQVNFKGVLDHDDSTPHTFARPTNLHFATSYRNGHVIYHERSRVVRFVTETEVTEDNFGSVVGDILKCAPEWSNIKGQSSF